MKVKFFFVAIVGIITFLSSACSLDMRISDLSNSEKGLSQNPSASEPASPETPSSGTPVVSKPSGLPFFNYHASSIKNDSQGRTIYSGYFSSFTFDKKNIISKVARLNSDGSLDESFNTGIGYNSNVNKLLLSANQEVISTGTFTQFNQAAVTKISRLQSDGELELTYSPAIYLDVNDIALTSDDKVIAVGQFYYWENLANPQETIVRINADGTRDTSFNIGTSFSPVRTATEIAIQSDNKIIIGGNFNSYNGNSSPKIVRLNVDGTYDNTFITGTGFNGSVFDLEILASGKIVAVGSFTSYNGTNSVNGVALLNANGTIDAAFTANIGAGFTTGPYVVKEVAGVGILIGGNFDSFQGSPAGGIICLNYDGSICSSVNFGTGINVAAGSVIYDIKKMNSTTVLVAGAFSHFNSVANKNLVALNLDGSASSQFSNFKGVDSSVSNIQIQNDGKVVIGGGFTIYNPQSIPKVVRFNADQTLDEDFANAVASSASIVSASDIAVDADDNIWVAGMITPNGFGTTNLLRLSEAGNTDSTCISALGSGFNSSTSKISLLDNGKLLLNGNFSAFNGASISKVAILNDDCSLDTNFSTGTGIVGNIKRSHLQTDGKLIIVGSMTSYSGTAVSKVIRVDSNGVLDATYPNNAAKPSSMTASFLDSSNRLYLSSSGGTFNGGAIGTFGRILPNGSVDPSFNVGTGFNTIPMVVKVFDNKIFVGGDFTTFNSANRRYFIILNEDGSEDTSISRPEAVFPVQDIYFNSITGKIEFSYRLPEITG